MVFKQPLKIYVSEKESNGLFFWSVSDLNNLELDWGESLNKTEAWAMALKSKDIIERKKYAK